MIGTFCLSFPIAMLSKYLHRRMGADPARFPERLGHSGFDEKQEVVWFHAASLGEVKQIGPLTQHLYKTGQTNILITTTTATGADWVAQEMPHMIHRFAPIDTPGAVRQFLSDWPIAAALFIEGDLMPRMIGTLAKQHVPHILLNARNSRTRARFPAVFRALLSTFDLVTCRSDEIAQGMRALGLNTNRLRVLPDLRLTLPVLTASPETTKELSDAIGTRPIWLAASTHAQDETAVLSAHLEVLAQHPDALLIVAPRHPTRGAALQKLAHEMGITVARRSTGDDIVATTQLYIADTLGELGAFYTLAPVAFLGGSFGSEGGHNPYEPASFETAILFGPNVENFSDAFAALGTVGAARQVADTTDLGAALINLMQGDKADMMAGAGKRLIIKQQKSVSTYADLIRTVLSHR